MRASRSRAGAGSTISPPQTAGGRITNPTHRISQAIHCPSRLGMPTSYDTMSIGTVPSRGRVARIPNLPRMTLPKPAFSFREVNRSGHNRARQQKMRAPGVPCWCGGQHPVGDAESGPIRLSFNPQLRVEFRRATVTSDAGLLLPRELDERLGLSVLIERHLSDPRTGRNT